jgi:hypothetical protein
MTASPALRQAGRPSDEESRMAKARRKKSARSAGKPLTAGQKKVIAQHILATEAALKTIAAHVKKLRRATKKATVYRFL